MDEAQKANGIRTGAIICGLVAMATGVAVFLFWYYARSTTSVWVGLTITAMDASVVIGGFIALIVYWGTAKPKFSRLILPLVVLLANAPIALYLALIANSSTLFFQTVSVISKCDKPAEIVLTGPDKTQFKIAVGANKTLSKRLDIAGEGSVYFKMIIDGKATQTGTAIGYITDGVEIATTLKIDQQCKARVRSGLIEPI